MAGTKTLDWLAADVGTGSVGSGSTPSGREFLQTRLADFGRIGLLIGVGVILAMNVLLLIRYGGQLTLVLGCPANLTTISIPLALAALWLLCRGGSWSLTALRRIDIAFTLFVCLAATVRGCVADLLPNAEFTSIAAIGNVLVFRAIIVPSTPSRSATIAGLALAPLLLGPVLPFVPGDSAVAENWVLFTLWGGVAAAVSVVASTVIYGLRRRVREAHQLGQYTLEELVGEGGMGQVYRACHAMLRRPTAIKLLRPDAVGEHVLRRFEREVQQTARLTHPNTIAIYDYGHTADGVFYYAMEYLTGIDLQTLVERHGPQPPARVIAILRQVCGSLAEAHDLGLIHRDIKPANIVLCARGGEHDVVKVVDFGLVKDMEGDPDASATGDSTITGTPLYLPPEAVRQSVGVDARSDLYSLGAVGYFLLTGKEVFEAETVMGVISQHLGSPPVAPSKRAGVDVPADLEDVVLGCLAKEKGDRPRDARELAAQLDECADAKSWSASRAAAWWAAHGADSVPALPPVAEGARAKTLAVNLGPSRRPVAS